MGECLCGNLLFESSQLLRFKGGSSSAAEERFNNNEVCIITGIIVL